MKKWIHAMRLRTLPLAASCVLMGAAVAHADGAANPMVLSLILLTTFLLQILSNFANDYGDYSHGVDNEHRLGPKRTLQSGAISAQQMRRALVLISLLTLISGLVLLWCVFSPMQQFMNALLMLIIGLLAIAAAIKYTVGNNPYGYRGLGDVFVFLFFGPVGVLGTYFLLTNGIHTSAWMPAFTIGFFSTAVLNLNNLRDHENDRTSGKRTLVVQMGFEKGKIYQTALICFGILCFLAWLILSQVGLIKWLSCIPAFAQLALLPNVWRTTQPRELDPELKKVAMLTFLTALILFLVC